MKWRNKTISLHTLVVTPVGVVNGRCDTCQSADCSHNVEFTNVALFGVVKKMRCLIGNNGEPCLVVECDGYTP